MQIKIGVRFISMREEHAVDAKRIAAEAPRSGAGVDSPTARPFKPRSGGEGGHAKKVKSEKYA